ncbi:carotenoid 9,10(9',10')-cleavage dioxygenase [Amborella trichopoda]|uniref:carotenoid 9,10(9',10')-cleavage dioxygenase n=1 Tax=Amborella trichopoda TaxID=13333 RepID=UPI0005D33E00|nr:carotenoid 9,10(9',10')-cleavage dioxygenase [Amborella trichopoda]|eukprot:XP_011626793.1 carotenoid 9,10(9',10')-cleavage dioxygenase [Amborella trichopoda]
MPKRFVYVNEVHRNQSHPSKDWPRLPLKERITKTLQSTAEVFLDAFVENIFHFVKQPMLVQGNYAPVNPIGEPVMISSVEGQIPNDFPEGVYIRNGPNPLFGEMTATQSIFGRSSAIWVEGDGMLHALYFHKDNKGNWNLSYKNKYIESDSFTLERERNRPLFLPVVEGQPAAVLVGALLNQLRFGKHYRDMNNTNIFEHGGKVFSIAENHLPYEIDVSSLDTMDAWDINGAWDRPFTSHPKRDPQTGELVIMGIDSKKPFYVLGVISADGKRVVHKVDLKFERSTLVHENAITKNFNVIMDYPLIVDPKRVIDGRPLIKFEKHQKARIGIIPRYGDVNSTTWFDVETHCTFHIINSFEEGDEVVVRGCRAEGSTIPGPDLGVNKIEWFRRAFLPVGREEGSDPSIDGILFTRVYEWRLNMKIGSVKEGYLTGLEVSMDFPAINNKFMGLKNKYGYTQVVDSIESSRIGLAKYNMYAKLNFEELEESHGAKDKRIKVEYHRLEENQYCSGAVFVSRPGGSDEDDGWIVCFAHNENTNISEVQIIDAKKFTEAPVAKIAIPCRVPYGFHGTFVCKTKNDFSKCM